MGKSRQARAPSGTLGGRWGRQGSDIDSTCVARCPEVPHLGIPQSIPKSEEWMLNRAKLDTRSEFYCDSHICFQF